MIKRLFMAIVYLFATIGVVLVFGYFAVRFGWTNTSGIIDNQRNAFLNNEIPTKDYKWAKGEEWQTLKVAVLKDKEIIKKVESVTGINSRIIVAQLVVEQLRLFHTNREIYKLVFAPLKILGNQSQFSWGVMGIKQETAIEIEKNLKDITSPFYLGKELENILDFKTLNPDQERFERIVKEDDRYYSYLYSALYIKQIRSQWKNAGFDISDKPGIESTLYNIGFKNSKPKIDSKIGGAEIEINGEIYSFGSLAEEFYYSDELMEDFPRM